jgi:hypothetical protein
MESNGHGNDCEFLKSVDEDDKEDGEESDSDEASED